MTKLCCLFRWCRRTRPRQDDIEGSGGTGPSVLENAGGKINHESSSGNKRPDTRDDTVSDLTSLHDVPGLKNTSNSLINMSDPQIKKIYDHRRMVHKLESTLGKDHLDVAKEYINLAVLSKNQSQFDKTEKFFQRALKIYVGKLPKESGSEVPDRLYTLQSLLIKIKSQKGYEDVVMLCEAVLEEMDDMTCPSDQSNLFTALKILQAAFTRESSEMEMDNLLSVLGNALGRENLAVTPTLNILAVLCKKRRIYKEAENTLCLPALQEEEKKSLEDKLEEANRLKSQALLSQYQFKFEEADSYYKRALVIYEKELKQDHTILIQIKENISLCQLMKNEFKKARTLYSQHFKTKNTMLIQNLQIEHSLTAQTDLKASSGYWEKVVIEENSTGHSYESVFGRFLDSKVIHITVEEPYLIESYQHYNFSLFCSLASQKCCNLKYINLVTKDLSDEAIDWYNDLESELSCQGITLTLEERSTLHDRVIRLSNGWTIKIGRGLHYFKKPNRGNKFDMDSRRCRETTVDIFQEIPRKKAKRNKKAGRQF